MSVVVVLAVWGLSIETVETASVEAGGWSPHLSIAISRRLVYQVYHPVHHLLGPWHAKDSFSILSLFPLDHKSTGSIWGVTFSVYQLRVTKNVGLPTKPRPQTLDPKDLAWSSKRQLNLHRLPPKGSGLIDLSIYISAVHISGPYRTINLYAISHL